MSTRKPTSSDLVLCHYPPFDTRWKHHKDQLIEHNSASIRFWDKNLLKVTGFPQVRRAKICRFPVLQPILHSLTYALDFTLLEQLEFEQLVLNEKEQITIIAKSLQVLSIDSVEIVDLPPKPAAPFKLITPRQGSPKTSDSSEPDDGLMARLIKKLAKHEPVEPVGPLATEDALETSFKCESPKLFAVYLGTNAIHHVKFHRPETLTTLQIEYVPYDGVDKDPVDLGRFKNLQVLELNQVQNFNLDDILKFARNNRQLKQLLCTTRKLTDLMYRPTDLEYRELARVYRTLKNELNQRSFSKELEIFLNLVRLGNNQAGFAHFGFDEALTNLYFMNWVTVSPDRRPNLTECPSVSEVDYTGLCEILPCLSSSDIRLEMLLVAFPNLQRITFDGSKISLADRNERLAKRFRNFLLRCNSLTELTLLEPNFKPAFYNDLVSVHSLRTLNTLTILEKCGFSERIDFAFLQHFEYLRRFSTNLANKNDTLVILERVLIDSEFRFTYEHAPGQASNQLVAQVIPDDGQENRVRLVFVKDARFGNWYYDKMVLDRGEWLIDQLESDVFNNVEYDMFFRHFSLPDKWSTDFTQY